MTNVYLNLKLNLFRYHQTMAGSQCKQAEFVDLDLLAVLPEDFSSVEALPIGGLASDIDLDHLAVLPGDSSDETLPSGLLASVISPLYVPFVAGSTDQAIRQPAYKIIHIWRTYKNIPDLPSDVVIHDETPPSDDMLIFKVIIQHILKGIKASFFSEMKNSEKLTYNNYIINRFFVRLCCHAVSQQLHLMVKVHNIAFLLQPSDSEQVFYKDASNPSKSFVWQTANALIDRDPQEQSSSEIKLCCQRSRQERFGESLE